MNDTVVSKPVASKPSSDRTILVHESSGAEYATGGPVLTEIIDDKIVVLKINRPEAANALNQETFHMIRDNLQVFQRDRRARVMIITAEGRFFSAGLDLKAVAAGWVAVDEDMPNFDNITKPIIAAVNGKAFGGGFMLALRSDICIMSEEAQIGVTEAKFGRGAPWAGSLPKLLSSRIAMEMFITAQAITAQRAYEVGFANAVVPTEDVFTAALKMAKTIAGNAPLTVRAGKATVDYILRPSGEAEALKALWAPVYASPDAIEGPRAFAEKREPQWQDPED